MITKNQINELVNEQLSYEFSLDKDFIIIYGYNPYDFFKTELITIHISNHTIINTTKFQNLLENKLIDLDSFQEII